MKVGKAIFLDKFFNVGSRAMFYLYEIVNGCIRGAS